VAFVRILGIDPGTVVVGFGCLELRGERRTPVTGGAPLALRAANAVRAGAGGGSEVRIVDCGVLRLGRSRCLPDRLLALSEQLRTLLERLQPDELALEEAFHGKSVPSTLRIGEARGVVLAEAARAALAIHQYAPARIKRCVTGAGDAGKDAVAAMVLQQLGGLLPATGPAFSRDTTDALAVAFTRMEERRSPLLHSGQLAGILGEPVRPRRRRRVRPG